jgi:hypothetical protein
VVRVVNIFEAFLWSKGPSQHNDLKLSKPKRKRDALRVWTFHQFRRMMADHICTSGSIVMKQSPFPSRVGSSCLFQTFSNYAMRRLHIRTLRCHQRHFTHYQMQPVRVQGDNGKRASRAHNLTRSNEAQREAYQKCFLEYYYCATVRGELSDIPAKTAGPYIHVGQA